MKIIIDDLNEGERIDLFLAKLMPEFSRSKLQNCIKNGGVLLNTKKIKPSYALKNGDILVLDEKFLEKNLNILPEEIPLEIVWEDENMAVVNKPSNMLTHPTTVEISGTLVNALLNHYGQNLSDIGGDMRRGIVHRLDRNTSGLIMIAKNNKTHEYLVEQMKEKKFVKKYLAVVKGIIADKELVISEPIGRHHTQPHKMAVNGNNAKDSISIVKVLSYLENATLIEVTLITGRTHQIRVHLSNIGHPIYNDTLYGFGKMKINTEEQVLQSYKLEFTKPFAEEKISLEIEPDIKIKKVVNALKTN